MSQYSPVERIFRGRDSIPSAMGWMFFLSFILAFLLGWIPLVGPYIGPAVGGFVGGVRAGSIGRALLAALVPAILLSALIFALGAVAAGLSNLPAIGGLIAALVGGAVGVVVVLHNIVLFVAAFLGGALRQIRDANSARSDNDGTDM